MDKRVFFIGELGVLRAVRPALVRQGATVDAFSRLADLEEALRRDPPDALFVAGYSEDGDAVASFHALRQHLRPRTLVLLPRRQSLLRDDLLLAGAGDVVFSGARARTVLERLCELAGLQRVPRPSTVLDLPAELFLSGRLLDGRLLELSSRSATAVVREPVAANVLLKLRLALPSEVLVTLNARVLTRRTLAADQHQLSLVLVGMTRSEEQIVARLSRPPTVDPTPVRGLLAPAPGAPVFDAAEPSLGPLFLAGPDAEPSPEERTPLLSRPTPPPDVALARLFDEALARPPPPQPAGPSVTEFLAAHPPSWPALPPLAVAVEALEKAHANAEHDRAEPLPDGPGLMSAARRVMSEMTALEHDVFRPARPPPPPAEVETDDGELAFARLPSEPAPQVETRRPFLRLRALVRLGAGLRLRLALAEEQARHLLAEELAGDVDLDDEAVKALTLETSEWLELVRASLAQVRAGQLPAEPADLKALELGAVTRLRALSQLVPRIRELASQPRVEEPASPAPVSRPRMAGFETARDDRLAVTGLFDRLLGRVP